VKGVGIGIVRWLVGLIFGLAAAALLFGLAARVASAAEVTSVVGPLALLAGGFGIAFFPVVFSMGTRSPRQVARRGLVGLAIEGLIALALVAYKLIAQASPVPASALGWLGTVDQAARDLAQAFGSDVLVGVLGLLVFAVGLLLYIALRPSVAGPAVAERATGTLPASGPSSPTTRAPALGQSRPTAVPGPTAERPAAQPAKTDDEDAQLMADLESLRKRLPTMGVDEPGSSGKS
jgi:hypothetical protein